MYPKQIVLNFSQRFSLLLCPLQLLLYMIYFAVQMLLCEISRE